MAASTVALPGRVKVGGVESSTVTVNVPGLLVLPLSSCAEQLTVVTPNGNVLPEAGVQEIIGVVSKTSVAAAVNVYVAPVGPVASIVALPGTVKVGASVSCTVTIKVLLPVFPAVSVAEQVTVVAPMPNVFPEVGLQVTVGFNGSIRSVAVAVNVYAAPVGPVA